jgi:ABC-type branched-subunit amino acid transport system substrate-binding protein
VRGSPNGTGIPTGISLVGVDDESDGDVVASLYASFVNWTAGGRLPHAPDAIFGPFGTSLTRKALQALNGSGYPLLASPAGESLFEEGFSHLFGVATTTAHYTEDLVPALVAKGATTFAIGRSGESLSFLQDLTSTTTSAITSALSASALRTTITYPVPDDSWAFKNDTAGTNALNAQIDALKAPNSSVIFSFQKFSSADAVVTAMDARDARPRALILNSAPSNQEWIDDLGVESNWLMAPAQWHPSVSSASYSGDTVFGNSQDWADDYESAYSGLTAEHHGAAASAIGRVFAEAYVRAASATNFSSAPLQSAITGQIRATNMTTLFGPVAFDSRGENRRKPMLTTQVQLGGVLGLTRSLEVVLPESVKTADLRFPAPINEPPRFPNNIATCVDFTLPITNTALKLCVRIKAEQSCDINATTTLVGPLGNVSQTQLVPLLEFTQGQGITGDSNCFDIANTICQTCTHWDNVTMTGNYIEACVSQELICGSIPITKAPLGCFDDSDVIARCLANCPSKCNLRGTCDNGVCQCQTGWSGASCNIAECTTDCGGELRGECVNGVCQCKDGFSGSDCLTASGALLESSTASADFGLLIALLVIFGVLVLAGVVAFLVYRQRKKAGDRNAHDARENAMRIVEEDSDDSSSLRSDVSLTHTESESSF